MSAANSSAPGGQPARSPRRGTRLGRFASRRVTTIFPEMPQRDFVLRWIEEIVRTVHRMLFGPGAVDLAMAESRVEDAIAQLLGPLTLLIPRLDVPSASDLLGEPSRIMGLGELLDLKAAVEEANGDAAAAEATRTRAAAFRNEAARRDPRVLG